MLKTSRFLGAGTVGERGQVVIPADARKQFGIETGDKVMFFGHPKKAGLFIIKADMVDQFVSSIINEASSLGKLLTQINEPEEETQE